MKNFKILFFLLLFSSVGASAQYGNDYYTKNYGVNRNIARSYNTPQKPSPEQIEKNRQEQLDKFMDKLKKDLTLDELQTIAIRNEIDKNNKNIDIVIKKETSEDEKSKEITSMMERTDKLVNSYLNPVQKEKYKVLVEENKKKKDGRKDKKGKKENQKEDLNGEELKPQE